MLSRLVLPEQLRKSLSREQIAVGSAQQAHVHVAVAARVGIPLVFNPGLMAKTGMLSNRTDCPARTSA